LAVQNAEETKTEIPTKNLLVKNLDFSKLYETEGMKSPQDSSGEETKNDSRGILREILADSDNKNDSAEQNFEKEIRSEIVS
jgi:hypothetical protein